MLLTNIDTFIHLRAYGKLLDKTLIVTLVNTTIKC